MLPAVKPASDGPPAVPDQRQRHAKHRQYRGRTGISRRRDGGPRFGAPGHNSGEQHPQTGNEQQAGERADHLRARQTYQSVSRSRCIPEHRRPAIAEATNRRPADRPRTWRTDPSSPVDPTIRMTAGAATPLLSRTAVRCCIFCMRDCSVVRFSPSSAAPRPGRSRVQSPSGCLFPSATFRVRHLHRPTVCATFHSVS